MGCGASNDSDVVHKNSPEPHPKQQPPVIAAADPAPRAMPAPAAKVQEPPSSSSQAPHFSPQPATATSPPVVPVPLASNVVPHPATTAPQPAAPQPDPQKATSPFVAPPAPSAAAPQVVQPVVGAVTFTVEEAERESELLTKVVIDEEMALEQVSQDSSLLQELNEMLSQQYQSDFPLICKSITQSEWSPMWHSAHSLKGAASNLGVNRVARCCQLLEHFGKELDNLIKGGKEVTPDLAHKATIYRDLLEKHWKEYLIKYADFTSRMNKDNG